MQTFPTASRAKGLTTIELLAALMLLVLFMVVALPSFQSFVQHERDKEMNRLTNLVRALRNDAILNGKIFRIAFDLKKKTYHVEEREGPDNYKKANNPKLYTSHTFPPEFALQEAKLLGRTYTPNMQKLVLLEINSSGFVDPFVLWFTYEEEAWILEIVGVTGKIKLRPNSQGFVPFSKKELFAKVVHVF